MAWTPMARKAEGIRIVLSSSQGKDAPNALTPIGKGGERKSGRYLSSGERGPLRFFP
jgi:hypothetical protein